MDFLTGPTISKIITGPTIFKILKIRNIHGPTKYNTHTQIFWETFFYCYIIMIVTKSTKKDKRFKTTINGRTFHFGSKGANTYIDGATEETKQNYLKRHRVNEDWTKINNGSLSRFILWGDSRDINKNIKNYEKKFNV
jgi:hypothetical protein